MKISIVVAIDLEGAIGKHNALPWHLPADLRHFKRITIGKPIVMGRKTHESIGRVLPDRENIILTRDQGYQAEGCVMLNQFDMILERYQNKEIMVIGGATVYQYALKFASLMYLTKVHATVCGDVFFPDYDESKWKEISRQDFYADSQHVYDYSFVCLERVA